MTEEHYLPYDYTRCNGTEHPVCSDCLRKLSPWNEYRQSVFMTPHVSEDGTCKEKISRRIYEQRD